MSYHHIHGSGHIYGPQLKQAIGRINPGVLVPIHTVKIVKNGETPACQVPSIPLKTQTDRSDDPTGHRV